MKLRIRFPVPLVPHLRQAYSQKSWTTRFVIRG